MQKAKIKAKILGSGVLALAFLSAAGTSNAAPYGNVLHWTFSTQEAPANGAEACFALTSQDYKTITNDNVDAKRAAGTECFDVGYTTSVTFDDFADNRQRFYGVRAYIRSGSAMSYSNFVEVSATPWDTLPPPPPPPPPVQQCDYTLIPAASTTLLPMSVSWTIATPSCVTGYSATVSPSAISAPVTLTGSNPAFTTNYIKPGACPPSATTTSNLTVVFTKTGGGTVTARATVNGSRTNGCRAYGIDVVPLEPEDPTVPPPPPPPPPPAGTCSAAFTPNATSGTLPRSFTWSFSNPSCIASWSANVAGSAISYPATLNGTGGTVTSNYIAPAKCPPSATTISRITMTVTGTDGQTYTAARDVTGSKTSGCKAVTVGPQL